MFAVVLGAAVLARVVKGLVDGAASGVDEGDAGCSGSSTPDYDYATDGSRGRSTERQTSLNEFGF